MEKAVQIDSLYYSYNSSSNALEDISLGIEDNEFTAIIGHNGSGKTTLLKNITGLLRPTKGDIFIRGKNSREMSVSAISSEIGFVMQNPDRQLFADTVYAEAAFALKNMKLPDAEIARRVEEALAAAELSGLRDAYPPALSRGERAKLVIASVLAMGPGIIILDEPTGGQDYRNSLKIMDLAASLHQKGHTIIFVTHNMSLACAYAGRIIVMKEKRVIMDGKAEDIFCRGAADILPPQIVRLSRRLREELPLPKDALTVKELGDMLLKIPV
jgi:energy-coupling factor transport system ATP-binding protein